ncbi:voltage-dependent calcium channel subunit alpha-2/delta-3-like isoform X2 [Galleria mellonella]|uniref:Voltage-dependent calcium channel subunit alpha-2/delta-3-like isoform X2 n=1 Tax=Galleria mellonella TaxID=7137 RepID=A0A6J3BSW1_GALME|nr:voltage-dependent calcium channel subunit alpha-2/delta-3-like isoform X2 [Galleria mellonella]
MNLQLLIIVILISCNNCLKQKNITANKLETNNKSLSVNKTIKGDVPKKENATEKKPEKIKIPVIKKIKPPPKMISLDLVREWAEKISEKLLEQEERVVHRKALLQKFSDINIKVRNGTAIVQKMAKDLEELLLRRTQAVENIMRRAEELANFNATPPEDYTFDYSVDLNVLKKMEVPESDLEKPYDCRSLNKVNLARSMHFDADVSMATSSVYVSPEVFDCNPDIVKHLYWSEGLLSVFKENYAQDSTMDFQYFCSAKGFLRHYPAALWESMYKLKLDADSVYDCRLRPWYVSAGGAPRDVLVLLDATGSMSNSTNQVIAKNFLLALLNALTDDDHVNVLKFNTKVQSLIRCFNEKFVPANHVNTAAITSKMDHYALTNKTDLKLVFRYAVQMLQKQRHTPDHPPSCQQIIIIVTDSVDRNYTELLRDLDPTGQIRLFVIWLHDPYGLRDSTREYGDIITCDRDGHFAELSTDADVTEQVMRILRILERPLVAQREQRLRVFSDVYAHVEDPRRAEYYWSQKENAEQAYRYRELRRDKKNLLSDQRLYKDYMHQESLEKYGYYYEGEDINYRLQISISVPVFDHITVENITKTLDEYPVNRLLGVAGVDIPVDHLKMLLPYHQVGAGGTLFLIDHRGNIVLHDNLKPTFDGDILKPGYRTIDFSDIEQAGISHPPRYYPQEWKEFRKALVIDQAQGTRTILSKNIFEGGMRAIVEEREYHWSRILDHYTAVVVIPKYNRRRAVPSGNFTQELAKECLKTLSRSDFSIHPDWLYCRHVEPYFDSRNAEVLHFIRRRSDEPNFVMKKLKHLFSPIPPSLLEKTYQCDEELMAHMCKEAIATSQWAEDQKDPDEDASVQLGSVTAFFASESGLSRWQQYHAASRHADPPSGAEWARGPDEPWYARAAAAPGALLLHAPVTPHRRLRSSDATVAPVGTRAEWLTAARTIGHSEKGIIGVAGFHFYPQHLEDFLELITNFPCNEEEDDCETKCDGTIWSCVLVDEGGWIVAGDTSYTRTSNEDPVRRHLAAVHPAAMAALLDAKVFRLNWIHDYQGVCFNYEDSKDSATSIMVPSLLKSIWRSVTLLLTVSREIATILTLLINSNRAWADTEAEKEKRRNRLKRDYEREKFDRLFDEKVLVNRTTFAACDRSRPMYELQRTAQAMSALKRTPAACSWPLGAAIVPDTNLLLLAIYNVCPYTGKPVPDPLNNEPVDMVKVTKLMKKEVDWNMLDPASRLACWRNIEPLPGRPPHMQCYPHNYTQEEGYRQCGPWLPDPDPETASHSELTKLMPHVVPVLLLIYINNLYVQL